MNWVDAAIIGIVVFYALLGVKRGFLAVASELIALATGIGVALLVFRPVGTYIAQSFGVPKGFAHLGAFATVWIILQLVLAIAFHLMLKRVPKETTKGPVNRALGILPSLVKGIIAAALIVTLLSLSPRGTAAEDVRDSWIGKPMVEAVIRYEAVAYNTFHDVIGDIQKAVGRETVVEGYQELPFKTTDVETRTVAEREMLRLVNRERTENGLKPLVMDETLTRAARLHSKDMLARGYFSHQSPNGETPFERMRKAGVKYSVAGENLAFAITVEIAHEGLMKSPGHRKNILTLEYRRVGIGAVRAGARGTMFTQNFAD